MKYIITEQQNNKLIDTILKYFDGHLVPGGGWEDKKSYHDEMDTSYEMFFFFDPDFEGNGDEPHMFYTLCDNPNEDPLPEHKCPMITIDSKKYDALDGYFGPRWQELFKRWFTKHTGLPVKHVERQSW
jgi:hypothetical protein